MGRWFRVIGILVVLAACTEVEQNPVVSGGELMVEDRKCKCLRVVADGYEEILMSDGSLEVEQEFEKDTAYTNCVDLLSI